MTPIRKIVSRRKKALKSASPKSRDRLRREYHVAVKAAQLKGIRAA